MYLAHISGRKVLDIKKPAYTNGQNILDIQKVQHLLLGKKMYLTYISGWKVLNTEIAKQFSPSYKKSQKVNNSEIIPSEITTLHIDYTIKLFAKVLDVRCLLSQKPSTIE